MGHAVPGPDPGGLRVPGRPWSGTPLIPSLRPRPHFISLSMRLERDRDRVHAFARRPSSDPASPDDPFLSPAMASRIYGCGTRIQHHRLRFGAPGTADVRPDKPMKDGASCAAPGGPSLTVCVIRGGDGSVEIRAVFRCEPDLAAASWRSGGALLGRGRAFSFLDLSGPRFPLWVSRTSRGAGAASPCRFPGATGSTRGRVLGHVFPQPTVISSGGVGIHLESRRKRVRFPRMQPEIECREVPRAIGFLPAKSRTALVGDIARLAGPLPCPPGPPGRHYRTEGRRQQFPRGWSGSWTPVCGCGLWCGRLGGCAEDGLRYRLFWNWEWDADPRLPEQIASLDARGIRPGLCQSLSEQWGGLFNARRQQGFLVRDSAGEA